MAGENAQAFQYPLVEKNDSRSGRVLDAITNNQPRPGYDMLSTPTPGGVILNAAGGGKGVRGTDHPWRFRRGTGKKFTLTTGTVNSIVPEGMDAEFTAASEGVFVYVKATLDTDGSPSVVALLSAEEPPEPDLSWFNAEAPPSETYYPVLRVFADDDAVSRVDQIEVKNLNVTRSTVAVGCVTNQYQTKWETV